MSYKILEVSQVGETIITKVSYAIDGETVIVDIPHMRPQTKAELLTSIEKREVSEIEKLKAIKLNATIIEDLKNNPQSGGLLRWITGLFS